MNKPARFVSLLVALSMVLFLFFMVSCSKTTDEDVIHESLSEELDTIKNLDGAFMDELIEATEIDELSSYGVNSNEFMETYLSGFDYSIDEVTVDGDRASATISMTCKSFSDYKDSLEEAVENMENDPDLLNIMTEEEFNVYLGDLIMKTLEEVDAKQTEPITIDYTKTDNTWVPSSSASQDIIVALMTN